MNVLRDWFSANAMEWGTNSTLISKWIYGCMEMNPSWINVSRLQVYIPRGNGLFDLSNSISMHGHTYVKGSFE